MPKTDYKANEKRYRSEYANLIRQLQNSIPEIASSKNISKLTILKKVNELLQAQLQSVQALEEQYKKVHHAKNAITNDVLQENDISLKSIFQKLISSDSKSINPNINPILYSKYQADIEKIRNQMRLVNANKNIIQLYMKRMNAVQGERDIEEVEEGDDTFVDNEHRFSLQLCHQQPFSSVFSDEPNHLGLINLSKPENQMAQYSTKSLTEEQHLHFRKEFSPHMKDEGYHSQSQDDLNQDSVFANFIIKQMEELTNFDPTTKESLSRDIGTDNEKKGLVDYAWPLASTLNSSPLESEMWIILNSDQ